MDTYSLSDPEEIYSNESSVLIGDSDGVHIDDLDSRLISVANVILENTKSPSGFDYSKHKKSIETLSTGGTAILLGYGVEAAGLVRSNAIITTLFGLGLLTYDYYNSLSDPIGKTFWSKPFDIFYKK